MIFVTTGTQEPFDRLLSIIQKLSLQTNDEFLIQGKTKLLFPKNVVVQEFLSPKEFDYYCHNSRLIISHAGMGTVISALVKCKPVVVFPRKASLGEHRNEHQMATAKVLRQDGLVYVAFSEDELKKVLNDLLSKDEIFPLKKIGLFANKNLLDSIEDFISN